jgi:RHS repeat-associated protein
LVAGSATDTYAYLDATETAWQTGQGTTTSSLLDATGSRLAVKTSTTVSWLLFDLHGSVVALCTSGTSTITDAYRFDGFGQQIQAAGTSTNPWRYRGLLNIGADSLTGALLDMGARDYSPQLGVFTQLDSVQGSAANPLTMNRFLYALANPATLIDPDGHMPAPMEGGGYVAPRKCVAFACRPEFEALDGGSGGGSIAGKSVGTHETCGACVGDPVDSNPDPGVAPPSLMEILGQCTVEYRLNNFDASCQIMGPEEREAESEKQQKDAEGVLPYLVVGAGLILLCVVACVPIATGLGLAAGSGSVNAAAIAYCAAACPATIEVVHLRLRLSWCLLWA